VRNDGAAQIKRPVKIHRHHPVPVFVGLLPHRRGFAGKAGIVHQNIDRFPALNHAGDCCVHCGCVSDIERQRLRAKPDALSGRSSCGRVKIGDAHCRACSGQACSNRLADSRCRSCDHGKLTIQIKHALSPSASAWATTPRLRSIRIRCSGLRRRAVSGR
jgi:hypothetical protein